MKKTIAQVLEWWLRLLLPPAPEPHGASGTPDRAPAPVAAVCCADPPTLQLPRIPVGDRFPIAWDTEPVPLYIVRYEQQRAPGAAR